MTKLRCKVAFLGESAVGKSSIIKKCITKQHPTQYSMTIGASVETFVVNIPNEGDYPLPKLGDKPRMYLEEDKPHSVEFLIMDIGGAEVFSDQIEQYLNNLNYFIIVYDVTNPNSFTNIPKYLRLIKTLKDRKNIKNIPGILVANKTDLTQLEKITSQEGSSYAQKNSLQFFSTSSVNQDVSEIFQYIAKEYYAKYQERIENIKYLSENKQW